jgi:3-hydroxybutyryl-CoA dehydratase
MESTIAEQINQMPNKPASNWTLDQIQEGQEHSFEAVVTETDLGDFSILVGDANPLHMDADFARARGFENRVVHGVFLGGLISRLVGMHLPGESCLLQELNLKFILPAYVGDRLIVRGVVDQRSLAVQAIVLRVEIASIIRGQTLLKGKAIVGFTGPKPP